jgi:diguanylate cyclase
MPDLPPGPPLDAGPPRRSGGVGLGVAALWLGLSGVLVAGASGYGLSLWLGPTSPWSAALGAALGLAVAAVPLALILGRVSRAGGALGRPGGALDALTSAGFLGGLPNRLMDAHGDSLAPVGIDRELFLNLAEREWARARRYGSGAALLWVDVDRYARLCEARGTTAGEAVVMQLLLQVAPSLRPADLITRLRHGRIAIFLAHADATGALDVAERIRERAEQQPVPAELPPPGAAAAAAGLGASSGAALRVTVSVGVAHLRPAHLNLQALMGDADDAVSAARQAGGNCVRAAPVDAARPRDAGAGSGSSWRGDDRRSRSTKPKQGGPK